MVDTFIKLWLVVAECTEGDVRLADGQNELEGRVEVCQEGLWGIPCGIGDWPKPNGIVVCRQVGVNATGMYLPRISQCFYRYNFFLIDVLSGTFGVGNVPRFTSVFSCSGNEMSLFNCTIIQEYSHSCSFEDAIGVLCIVSNESGEPMTQQLGLLLSYLLFIVLQSV